ncbi:MAG TPA: hypothetical protein VJ798_07475 [Rhizomicrobium sp.]|nr:hypothetical protein [Rhizomicrobium sp.]
MSTALQLPHFVDDAVAPPEILTKPWFKQYSVLAGLGLIIILINFPKLCMRLIDANIPYPTLRDFLSAPVKALQALLQFLVGSDPTAFFEKAMTSTFVFLWFFLLLLATLSFRARNFRMLGYGVLGIVVGYVALDLIAWTAVAVIGTINATVYVFEAVGAGISWIIRRVVSILPYLLFLVIVAVMAFVFLFARDKWMQFVTFLLAKLKEHSKTIFLIGALVAFLWIVVPLFYRWIVLPLFIYVFKPIGLAIFFAVKWLFIIVLSTVFLVFLSIALFLSLAFLGSLFISQLQAGWKAAWSIRHALIAGFAIGSALALIALVSIATPDLANALNQSWSTAILFGGSENSQFLTSFMQSLMPSRIERFAFEYLTNQQAPAFDSFILLTVLVLSVVSSLLRAASKTPITDEQIPLRFVLTETGSMMIGLFVGVALIVFGAMLGETSN